MSNTHLIDILEVPTILLVDLPTIYLSSDVKEYVARVNYHAEMNRDRTTKVLKGG